MFLPSQGPVRRVFVALCGGIFALSLFAQEDEPLTAEALFQLGRYEEAYPLLVNFEAEWSAKVRGEDSLETRMLWLGSLLGLGMVEDRLNKYDDALHHLSLARDLAVEGNFDPQTKGETSSMPWARPNTRRDGSKMPNSRWRRPSSTGKDRNPGTQPAAIAVLPQSPFEPAG